MFKRQHLILPLAGFLLLIAVAGCSDYYKNDYKDNSPTSGKLKVYYDPALEKHVTNQARTFKSHYPNTHLELFPATEQEAIQALFSDSCELIIIARDLSEKERQWFAQKQFDPRYSKIAKTGIALLTSTSTPLLKISQKELTGLLSNGLPVADSAAGSLNMNVIFDKNNSSVLHYVQDSILRSQKFSSNCSSAGSTKEALNLASERKGVLAIIDFSWLSDTDDSLFRALRDKLRFVAIESNTPSVYSLPGQSSFKLGTYPYTRGIYAIRKTGDFTLAKGFESYLAGPKGQLTFLKQGLLPTRQSERNITINPGGVNAE